MIPVYLNIAIIWVFSSLLSKQFELDDILQTVLIL